MSTFSRADWQAFLEKLTNPAHPVAVAISAIAIVASVYALSPWLDRVCESQRQYNRELTRSLDQAAAAREHFASLETLKTDDLERLKTGMSGSAMSQKSLMETGLSLQEERRLLEKQLEIMTTSLLINPSLQRIFLMQAEQPMQSYLLNYIPLRAFGGAPDTIAPVVRITSKERFAHPERGKSEEVNGTLQWTPPQVGSSVRSNALGEFVIFTNSALIIHGPPLNPDDHERFPHVCLGLDREAARKLYRASFIGTRIVLSHVAIERNPTSAALSTDAPPNPDLPQP